MTHRVNTPQLICAVFPEVCELEMLQTAEVTFKLGTHYPCPHYPCPWAVRHGPWIWVSKNDIRVHGPWTRVVCTELKGHSRSLMLVLYH